MHLSFTFNVIFTGFERELKKKKPQQPTNQAPMIPFGILSPTTLPPFLSPEKTFSGLFFFSLFPVPNKSKKK